MKPSPRDPRMAIRLSIVRTDVAVQAAQLGSWNRKPDAVNRFIDRGATGGAEPASARVSASVWGRAPVSGRQSPSGSVRPSTSARAWATGPGCGGRADRREGASRRGRRGSWRRGCGRRLGRRDRRGRGRLDRGGRVGAGGRIGGRRETRQRDHRQAGHEEAGQDRSSDGGGPPWYAAVGVCHDHPEDRPSRAPRHPPDVPSGDGPRLVSSAHRCYGRDLAATRGDAPRGRSPSRTDRAFCDPSFGEHQEVTPWPPVPSRRSSPIAASASSRARTRRNTSSIAAVLTHRSISTASSAASASSSTSSQPQGSARRSRARRLRARRLHALRPVFGRAVRMSGPPAHESARRFRHPASIRRWSGRSCRACRR